MDETKTQSIQGEDFTVSHRSIHIHPDEPLTVRPGTEENTTYLDYHLNYGLRDDAEGGIPCGGDLLGPAEGAQPRRQGLQEALAEHVEVFRPHAQLRVRAAQFRQRGHDRVEVGEAGDEFAHLQVFERRKARVKKI